MNSIIILVALMKATWGLNGSLQIMLHRHIEIWFVTCSLPLCYYKYIYIYNMNGVRLLNPLHPGSMIILSLYQTFITELDILDFFYRSCQFPFANPETWSGNVYSSLRSQSYRIWFHIGNATFVVLTVTFQWIIFIIWQNVLWITYYT